LTTPRVEHDFSAVTTLLLLHPGVVSFFVGTLVHHFFGLLDYYNVGRVNTLVLAFVKRFILLLALLFQACVLFDGPKLCYRLARILHTFVEFVGPFFVFFGTLLNACFVLLGPALSLDRALECYAEILLGTPDLVPFGTL